MSFHWTLRKIRTVFLFSWAIFEKLGGRVSGARFKKCSGWSENSSEITMGCSDGFYITLRQWEKYHCGASQKKVKIAAGWSEKQSSDIPYQLFKWISPEQQIICLKRFVQTL